MCLDWLNRRRRRRRLIAGLVASLFIVGCSPPTETAPTTVSVQTSGSSHSVVSQTPGSSPSVVRTSAPKPMVLVPKNTTPIVMVPNSSEPILPKPPSPEEFKAILASVSGMTQALPKESTTDLQKPLVAPGHSEAEPVVPKLTENTAKSENCWISTANRYKLDPYLLFAVAMVESGLNPKAVNINVNGSADLGMMQINTMHLPMLATMGIMPQDLHKPCTSIRVGGWILALNIYKYGYNWEAIGAYNAADRQKRANYARAVYAQYDRLKSWGEQYTRDYKAKNNGVAPPFVPKPPNDWTTPKDWKAVHAEATSTKTKNRGST